MELKKIHPKNCKRWQFADRDFQEFGDIISLAKDIKTNGQVEPVIVRVIAKQDKENVQYEVIAGSRRWKACLEYNMELSAIVFDEMSDEEAFLYQFKENEKKPLSDYSKGMSYHKIIESKVKTIGELANLLKISKGKLHHFLTFAKIPEKIITAIDKMEKVSSRSASTIYSLSKKGEEYQNALIEIAEDIKKGAGSSTIEKTVKNIIHDDMTNQGTVEYFISDKTGQTYIELKGNRYTVERNLEYDKAKLKKVLLDFFDKNGKMRAITLG